MPLVKFGCTPVEMAIRRADAARRYTECEAWRAWALDQIERLEPDAVVVGTHTHFRALGDGIPWAGTRCPVTERAAYEEAVWLHHPLLLGPESDVDDIVEAVGKIRDHLDELRTAEHPLVQLKSLNRAARR